MKYDDPQDIWDGVKTCPHHRHHMEDCTDCDDELTARGAVIDQMGAEAQDRLRGIAQQGGPQMPQAVILETQIDVLLDSILTDPKDRLRYEGEVGRRMLLKIKGMQEQIKQPALHIARDIPSNMRRK